MSKNSSSFFLALCFALQVFAQTPAPAAAPTPATPTTDKPVEEEVEKPNGKRIRRHLSLILTVPHDEELKIPEKELIYRGLTSLVDINRIKNTDFFRIVPKNPGSGIVTIHNKKTGQLLVELRLDIRKDEIEKYLRETQALLGDIEGIEYKIVNGMIVLDGYAILPKDMIRIGQVVSTMITSGVKMQNLVQLSPTARKKIVEYIARDVNNPEVSITAVGDYIKLEGVVNSKDERDRIIRIIGLYMPDLVSDVSPPEGSPMYKVTGKKSTAKIEDLIIDLTTIRPAEEKVEPPPKMIQIVAHFVEYNERYLKSFNFSFAPKLVDDQSRQGGPSQGPIQDTANLINRLLPKLQWAKKHGYARVLDTASILVQDRMPASINRTITIQKAPTVVAGGGFALQPSVASLSVSTTPSIKSERSGLVELKTLKVNLTDPNDTGTAITNVDTTISVRDRQSAAFGGTIMKKKDADFGGPTASGDSIIALNQGKNYNKNSSNFVVFITPIIKASASTGVDQVKKKFRLKE